ncbi:cellulose biosynthesis protein BcsD [Noviherbaspirillum galbum]|uniref:Cellulose synthase n=1 Tax=Noviherbaspirillum galbum TaxID=2709383 RepID=A0A6B3SHA7_9BURK|nr:cellulose biosynthesis protein BcsD [Noviherbaspirillum galbum]NEX60033.1 hypothetical protein [Noviherbaspirillum galbum]
MTTDTLEKYFRGQQVSVQWLPVLRAMGSELAGSADEGDLARLFHAIGGRMAASASEHFQSVQTLDQLQERLNAYWAHVNWGWVALNEVKGGMDIVHYASPLAEAFGQQTINWTAALLEGFYQSIFKVLGAGDKMAVRHMGAAAEGMEIHLRFGR